MLFLISYNYYNCILNSSHTFPLIRSSNEKSIKMCLTLYTCVSVDTFLHTPALTKICSYVSNQDLRKVEEAFEDPILVSTPAGGPGSVVVRKAGAGGGRLAGVLSADYYNRTLSGWEPFVEPWRLVMRVWIV